MRRSTAVPKLPRSFPTMCATCSPETCALTRGGSRLARPEWSGTWSGSGRVQDELARQQHFDAGYVRTRIGRGAADGFSAAASRHSRLRARHFPSHLCSLAAPPGALSSRSGRLSVRHQRPVDYHTQHPLPHGHGWNFVVAGGAYNFPDPAVRADFVDFDSRTSKRIFYPAAYSRNRAHWRLRRARSFPLLLLLGSHVDSHGAADRHLWPRPPGLCRSQILSLHDDRVGVHAGGNLVALCEDRHIRFRGDSERAAQRVGPRFWWSRAVAFP